LTREQRWKEKKKGFGIEKIRIRKLRRMLASTWGQTVTGKMAGIAGTACQTFTTARQALQDAGFRKRAKAQAGKPP
jgi:hypothetical protein